MFIEDMRRKTSHTLNGQTKIFDKTVTGFICDNIEINRWTKRVNARRLLMKLPTN